MKGLTTAEAWRPLAPLEAILGSNTPGAFRIVGPWPFLSGGISWFGCQIVVGLGNEVCRPVAALEWAWGILQCATWPWPLHGLGEDLGVGYQVMVMSFAGHWRLLG